MSYVNRGSVLAIGVVFSITSIAAVGARFAVRIHHRMLGIDDWLCLVAMFLVLGECAVFITGYATHSFGTHTPPMSSAQLFTLIDPSQQMLKKLEYVGYCLFIPALTLLKLSTLFFYKRLFRGRAFAVAFWCLSTISVMWGISFFVAWAAGCQNVQDHWISTATLKTKCANTFRVLIVQSVTDVIVDLALLILPVPFVFALKMPTKRKVGVCAILLVGALATGCGTYRMAIVIQALAAPYLVNPTVAGMRSNDIKGVVSALSMWSMLELGVAMVAVCLPTLRVLLQKESRKNMAQSMAQSLRSLIRLRSTTSSASPSHVVDSEQQSSHGGGSDDFDMGYVTKGGVYTANSSFSAPTTAMAKESNVSSEHDGYNHAVVPNVNAIPANRIVVDRTFNVSRVP